MLRQRNMNNLTLRMKQILQCSVLAVLMGAQGCASSAKKAEAPSGGAATQRSAAAAAPAPVQEALPPGISKAPLPFEGEGWHDMFDGRTLTGWRETKFAGRGGVQCQAGVILMSMGDPFTGINWTNDFPKQNYEIAFDAMRVMGSDFFCGLTVPVGTNFCSLIVGGWGGSLVGISSIDGLDASENETTKFNSFENGRWYRIRLRVTEKRLRAWIDQDKLIDIDIQGRRISTRPGEIDMSEPLGLACWQASAALREVKWRAVEP